MTNEIRSKYAIRSVSREDLEKMATYDHSIYTAEQIREELRRRDEFVREQNEKTVC